MSKKEIKIFLIAVLAIASVSLVTQIISGVASALSLLIDAKKIFVSGIGAIYNKEYLKLTATFLLIVTAISSAFVLGMICLCKRRRVKIIFSAATCGAVCLAFVILAVVLRNKIPTFTGGSTPGVFNSYNYELFQQFLTVGLADAVAVIIVFTSNLFLSIQPKERIEGNRKFELSTAGNEIDSDCCDSENNDGDY